MPVHLIDKPCFFLYLVPDIDGVPDFKPTKRMKTFKWIFLILMIGTLGYLGWHFLSPYSKTSPLEAIPYDAVFVAETDNLFDAWERLTSNKAWPKLRNQPVFSGLENGIVMMDTIIRSNRQLSEFVGHRQVFVSMHMVTGNKYDFAYVIDLRRISKILKLKDLVGSFSTSALKVTRVKDTSGDLFQIEMKKNGQKFYCYFNNNLFVGSFSRTLIEKSMAGNQEVSFGSDKNFSEIVSKTSNNGMFRFYINYARLDDYLKSMLINLDENTRGLTTSLRYTGLTFDIDKDGNIACDGYTMINDSVSSSLKAIINLGMGNSSIEEVLPSKFATSVSLCFNRFSDYFDNMQESMSNTPYAYDNYQKEIDAVENYLGISVRKNFLDWIGDEVTLAQMEPLGLGKNNEFAVFLKTRSVHQARENLEFIARRIKNRTPVKIEDVDYKGYTIHYLSVKGFFKMLLGKYFQKLESPYYILMGDYVVFSNHPQVLKTIIDAQAEESYLEKRDGFSRFYSDFGRQSNALVLVNTGNYLKTLQYTMRPQTMQHIKKSTSDLVAYPYAGFQLSKEGDYFKTLFYAFFNEILPEPQMEIAEADSISETDSTVNIISDWIKSADSFIVTDLKQTVFTESFPDGMKKVEFETREGFRQGNYREYYENGELKIKGEYKNDKKHGTWRFYSVTGKLIAKRDFKNGEQVK